MINLTPTHKGIGFKQEPRIPAGIFVYRHLGLVVQAL